MPSRSVSAAYLAQAAELAGNPGQLAAYHSQGHCVVLAGPGSGKTKTLVLKLARILAEDVQAPRGAACITYSQECARELTRRLEALGLREAPNLFIGTVHGFCLRHLLMPYGRLADLPIPFPLSVVSQRESERLLRQSGDRLFGANHPYKAIDLGRHRRSVLNRNSVAWRAEEELAAWAEAYEVALRQQGLIDYDDMVIFGQRLIIEHDWVLPLVQAKFPILAVDEYQDLGVALHRMVKRLAFEGGVRLFVVGDADQSIYGFTGADGALLLELADRRDVETVRLQLNYRSGAGIVNASEMVLGEVRGYRANDPNRQTTIAFQLCPDGLVDQAVHAVAQIIPAALAAKPGRTLGDIAILYKDYRAGDVVADAVTAGGWRIGHPQLRGLIDRYIAFHRARLDDACARRKGQELTRLLWALRADRHPACDFVASLRNGLVDSLLATEPTLSDQAEQLDRMTAALAEGGTLAMLDITSLGGRDGSPEHLNLLTLHSAKGCEYDVVIMVGLDLGNLPWRNEAPEKLRESRRLFYVGLTRARDEVHMLYSGFVDGRYGPMRLGRSPFLDELEERMRGAGLR